MKLKCIDDHRVLDKNERETEVHYENEFYEVEDKLGEELLATGKFERVEA